ncbi:MAG: ribonuclease P protein component 3, partial [Methanobacteriaceae archaeon]
NIISKNPNELQKMVKKYRNKVDVILAQGTDIKINRAVCENIKVDILSRPYLKDRGCGLNHVLAKEAVKNNVAIELCVSDILNSYLSHRAKFLANFREIIKFHNKFNFPLIISSGAKSTFDLKAPRDLRAIFTSLGLSNKGFDNAIINTPEEIIDFASKRSSYVVVGVREIITNNINDGST